MIASLDTAPMLATRVREALGGMPLAAPTFAAEIRVEVPPERLVAACAAIHQGFGAPLSTMVGLDDRVANAAPSASSTSSASSGNG